MDHAFMLGAAVALLGVFCLATLFVGGLAVHYTHRLQRTWKQIRSPK